MGAHLSMDGYTFFVDDADDHLVASLHCTTQKQPEANIRYVKVRGFPALHRIIAGVDGPTVDHADRDGLNNRRSNLRPATAPQNNANSKLNKRSVSGFKGVSKQSSGWLATISAKGKPTYLGYYDTPQDAARAYDAELIARHGKFARTNQMLGLL